MLSDNLDEEFNEILRTATKEELGLLLDLIRGEFSSFHKPIGRAISIQIGMPIDLYIGIPIIRLWIQEPNRLYRP